jgi:hypothetical protein
MQITGWIKGGSDVCEESEWESYEDGSGACKNIVG